MLTLEELEQRAHEMKARPTKAEAIFARRLEKARLRYETQLIIGWYIVDFVLPDRMVIVELDGKVHKTPEAKAHDAKRDKFLRSLGFQVIRMNNRTARRFPIEELINRRERVGDVFRTAVEKAQRMCYGGRARQEESYSALDVIEDRRAIAGLSLPPPVMKPRLVKKNR